uniref:ATP synthase subunit a n=1 Tax=Echinaster brasiliensis TaxID=1681203 RepID=A0A343XBL2_9ECHI|nr:ATP synthase F0 subunit 6 [Echinaster brasiliensis]AWK29626.1 ATP synthase subunit 6 [Echinaster brasiliensis]
MNMILNNIFSQFAPNIKFLLPITVIAITLNISWFLFINNQNWLPTRINNIHNLLIQTSVNTIFQQANPNTAPWLLPLSSLFFLILSINIIGLLPYAFTSTSHISITFSLGLPLWMAVNILGFYLAFNSRLSHLVPQGTPPYLIPLMVLIETISLFAQPLALGLRLAANLTAGHLLIFLLSTTIWTLINNPTIATLTFIIFILLFVLEIGVACIQAYVFTALINFYLNQNL